MTNYCRCSLYFKIKRGRRKYCGSITAQNFSGSISGISGQKRGGVGVRSSGAAKWRRTGRREQAGQELVAAIWETRIPRTAGQAHWAEHLVLFTPNSELTSAHEWQMVSTHARALESSCQVTSSFCSSTRAALTILAGWWVLEVGVVRGDEQG